MVLTLERPAERENRLPLAAQQRGFPPSGYSLRWLLFISLLSLVLGLGGAQQAQAAPEPLRIPAFTAYCEPTPDAVEVSEQEGILGWKSSAETLVWGGRLNTAGKLQLALALRLPAGETVRLRLRVGKWAKIATVSGTGQSQTVAFGVVEIAAPGYQRFRLEGVSKSGATFGNLEALLLSGPAAENAHFNLKPRRNAASVHLGYPIPANVQATWFYNEVTVRTEPIWSFYMACGFRRGYFGIQVNSPTERRIIFSVWDSGNEAVDRDKVAAENRVTLLAKGEGVVAESFGNEGTGGHSHLVYPWKKGQTYRFLVSAEPQGKTTTYTAYFYFPERQAWGLIARFRAPKDGDYLRGLHSFNENFGGDNGQLRRLAEFGNQWVKTPNGEWQELRTARFTHDPTGRDDRHDYGAGVIRGRFYLSNGGFVADPIRFGDTFERPASGNSPPSIRLPD